MTDATRLPEIHVRMGHKMRPRLPESVSVEVEVVAMTAADQRLALTGDLRTPPMRHGGY